MKNPALLTLLESARLAPSGDNTQPWRTAVDEQQSCVWLHLDPSQDRSPMNAGQHMARIALGAALENMSQTALHNQWQFAVQCQENGVSCRLLGDYSMGNVPHSILSRVTNRRLYSSVEILPSRMEALRTATPANHSQTIWVTQATDRAILCELIAQADSILLSLEAARRAFLEKVRFDQPVMAIVEEGLSLGCLELAAMQRLGLRLMPSVPNSILAACGGAALFRQAAARLTKSASGICVVSVACEPCEWKFAYHIGRTMERAWLALTAQQLHCQPMMSLPVLRNILIHQPADWLRSNQRLSIAALLERWDEFLERQFGCPRDTAGALLRFGEAQEPSVRTGRRKLNR